MCKSKVVTVTFMRKKSIIEKDFIKPKFLHNWCPNCDNDSEKNKQFAKSICLQLFKENCDLIYQIQKIRVSDVREYIEKIPDNLDDLEKMMGDSLDFNIRLKNILADKLAKEPVIYWDHIELIAPFLTSSNKKQLKKKISYIKNIKSIKELLNKYGNVNISTNKKNIIITIKQNITKQVIIVNKDDECSICFQNFAQDKETSCMECKYNYMCNDCEVKIKEQFDTCPFCMTPY